MKILFLSSQALFRETRFGGAKRLFYMAKELDSRVELHVICLDGCHEMPDPATFAPEFKRALALPLEPASGLEKIRFLPEMPKALGRHRDAISRFINDHHFDATFLAYPGALHFLDRGLVPFPGKTVYLEDDLLIDRFREDKRRARGMLPRLVKFLRYHQAVAFYRRNLGKVSRMVCISPQEAAIMHAGWPQLPVSLLSYGLPLREFPRLSPPADRHVLGFIGNYRHLPNLDAARWLIERLFPAVAARVPDATLILCGVGFPAELRALCAENPSITILNEVNDLAEFYGPVSVFVNCVREGRGMRTKVVEAAAYGRAVVSTRLGAEGLEELELGLFENEQELVGRLLALELPGAWEQAVEHNRRAVERVFSMERVGADLLEAMTGT